MEFEIASIRFSALSAELCNVLYLKGYENSKVNTIIDELLAETYVLHRGVPKHDVSSLMTVMCVNIRPTDEVLAAKASHLMKGLMSKQSYYKFTDELLYKVISWHLMCLKKCSEITFVDILHNTQFILQCSSPQNVAKFSEEFVGKEGFLISTIQKNLTEKPCQLSITLDCLKCIHFVVLSHEKNTDQGLLGSDAKEKISHFIINLLYNGQLKKQDEAMYCQLVTVSLRILSQLYLNQAMEISLPELIGICKHYLFYGLITQGNLPEKIMPAQQNIAPIPIVQNSKGGKKQKLRKQRNNAIEVLKKDTSTSDSNFLKEFGTFENSSAYKPASQNYLELHNMNTNLGGTQTQTSDSDASDVERKKEAKLIALKSRVRQNASSLLLVLVKVSEKRDMFGFWWSLLPDSPDVTTWVSDEKAKKTLAYCAVYDPISSSRASVLSVILALLSGSRMYLSQAETSKRESSSFIPFSESLGYIITCLHKVLTDILENERVYSVILVTLKCCAALVQATPYHKMKEGLITELVKSSRKFLVHRDITLQVGALITTGCVLSVDPKVDEVLKSVEKDVYSTKADSTAKTEQITADECEDFEEGYSDDEMFTAMDEKVVPKQDDYEFKSWVLDICFKNMGWVFRGSEMKRCLPSVIPVIMESLQVLSAIAFHHFAILVQPHLALVAEVVCEMMQHQHQDVILQAVKTASIIGDAIQKLEQIEQPPPLNQCVSMWEKFLTPLASILQSEENHAEKAAALDCIANIGERCFKELPSRWRVVWCTLSSGSCGAADPPVRAAAVRALAMGLVYRTLREDICFVSDCGESILRALAEPTLVVRTKAAWALGNLSDALVMNMDDPDIETIDDDLLRRLLEVSVQCATDNDKVKMSATRSLGNLLRVITEEHLQRNPKLKELCESALSKLLECATRVTNMKVRWNACYALGNAMKNDGLFTSFSGWQRKVFTELSTLSVECKNIKVRINASAALCVLYARAQYGAHLGALARRALEALAAAAALHDYREHRHKEQLLEQLCVTLAHLCCMLQQKDLQDLLDPLTFHYDCAKIFFSQLKYRLPPENPSCMKILEAAKHVTVDLTSSTEAQQQVLAMLQELFIFDM